MERPNVVIAVASIDGYCHAAMGGAAVVRVGVRTNGTDVTGWQYDILRQLDSDDRFVIVAAIVDATLRPSLPRWRLRRDWSTVPWHALDRMDQRVARRRHVSTTGTDPDDVVPLSDLPGAAPRIINVMPEVSPSGLIHRFGDADLECLAGLDLSVMLRFGFNILKGEVLEAARHGIWSFHHADNRINRGMPAGFWEVANGESYTGTILQRLTEDLDNGVVLNRATYATATSWNDNRRRIYSRSTTMMLDSLDVLARTGEPPSPEPNVAPFRLYDRPLMRAPSPKQVWRASLRVVGGMASYRIARRGTADQWRILLVKGGIGQRSLRSLTDLTPPLGRYWADPFVIDHAGETHLFFEDFDYAANRGVISTARVDGEQIGPVATALAPDYHLSYPFVFSFEGRVLMVPESAESGHIELWESVDFPFGWRKRRHLLDMPAVDSTLLHRDGRWWLFCNLDRTGSGDFGDELHIFVSDDLLNGEFAPHSANPVVRDARVARMGGPFTTDDEGQLLRIAQRGGRTYGGGLRIMRVDRLDSEAYVETEVEAVDPRWRADAVGIHHLCVGETYSVLDVCLRRPRREVV